MTQLTLDNWKEQIGKYEIISFVEALLALQKQALKDEAVKRIEEEWQVNSNCEGDTSYFAGRSSGFLNAINTIRNI